MKKGFLLCFALLVLLLSGPDLRRPEWLAAGCCQSQCSVNSDCDAICGPGLAGA